MINPHRPEFVVITKKDYHRLKRNDELLGALEAGGVDNWNWHSDAYRQYLRNIKGTPWDEGHADDLEDDDANPQ